MRRAAEVGGKLQGNERAPPNVHMGTALSFLLGLIGGMLGGYAGWLYGDGPVVLGSAFVGFALTFIAAFCSTAPGEHYFGRWASFKSSDLTRFQTLGLSNFDLYVTVHKVRNLYGAGAFLGLLRQTQNTYMEVKVGRLAEEDQRLAVLQNPVKRTCVSTSGAFEECFHFVVTPSDDTIRFVLYDQEIFSDTVVGVCDLRITEEIVSAGFPQNMTLRLLREEAETTAVKDFRDPGSLAGHAIVSFAPGSDFPVSAADAVGGRSKLALKKLREAQESLVGQTQKAGQYGTWATAA